MCEKHYRQYWRSINKEHNKEYAQKYHQNIRKPILQSQHKPKEKQCLRCNSIFKRTGANQKFCSKMCQNNLAHKKKRTNPEFKLIHNLRSRLRKALNGKSRDKGIMKITGCTMQELSMYLESKFKPGMTWDNYGKEWQIDHMRPLFEFDLTDPEQLKLACNFKNLQPISKEEHKIKSAIEQSERINYAIK